MPILFALILSLSTELEKFTSLFSIFRIPDDGLSINDKIFNNVDFPDPDGPTKE